MQGVRYSLALVSFVVFASLLASSQAAQITSVSPGSAPVGTLITIKGTNFGSYGFEESLSINGANAYPYPTSDWTNLEIQVVVPNSAAQGSGTIMVCPTACSNAYPFTVTNTLALETANNTSACSPSSNPTNNPSYCTAYFNGFDDTKNSKSQLQTYVVDSPAGHISLTESLYSLPAANTVCEYQPWFGSSGHKSVGYNENNEATVHAQVTNMIARGCTVVLVDWYGTSSAQQFNLTTSNLVYSDIKSRENPNYFADYPIFFAILEDQGSWDAACPAYQGITSISERGNTVTVATSAATGATAGSSISIVGVPISGYNGNWTVASVVNGTTFTYVNTQGGFASSSGGTAGADETSCIQSALLSDLGYIGQNYFGGPYWIYPQLDNDQLGNGLWTGFFICYSCFNADWYGTIWPSVSTWFQSNYGYYSEQLFDEFGKFGEPYSEGEFGWPQPVAWSSSNQYVWDYSDYLTNLYTQGQSAYANNRQGTVGVFYKGFDDNNASWGTNRVIAQQCGQVWMDTASFLNHNVDPYSFMQVATWNDYEEGTEIETGIDNCYTVTSSINSSTNTLNWTLNASSTYAMQTTINSFTVWYADVNGNLHLAKSNIGPSSDSLSLTGLIPAGSWTIYVEMVGQSSIINRMSNGVAYTP
jgi:hypothetical protein